MTANNELVVYQWQNTNNQKWKVENAGDGTITIKSMADNNGGGEEQAPTPEPMPNESRMVRTTMREMMNSVTLPPEDRKTERKEDKLSGKFGKKNPFVSPY